MNSPAPLAGILTLPIDTLDAAGPFQQRRTRASAEADAGLAESIRAMGLLQPILVRWNPDTQQHQVVDGHRRVAAARAAGLDSVRAVEIDSDERITLAAGVAANMQREALAPIDQWRAMVALQDKGWNLTGAAMALGLSMRAAKQLDKLGRLHPDVLDAIEAHGMPDEEELGTIALAPHDVQAAAIRNPKNWDDHWDEKTNTGNGTQVPDWYQVSTACIESRVSAKRAIFDIDAIGGITWDEDLFAQPGSDDQLTTRDIDAFLQAQCTQLRANSTRATGKKKFHAVEWNKKAHEPTLPKGWVRCFDNKTVGAERYAAVQTAGHGLGTVVEIYAVPPAKPAQAAAAPAGDDTAATATGSDAESRPDSTEGVPEGDGDTNAEDDEDLGGAFGSDATPAPIPVKPGRGPMTEKGRILLAQAKTTAIRCALRDRKTILEADLLAVLVLALAGDNVEVRGDPASKYTRTTFHDLAARLVNEDGSPADFNYSDVASIAAEAAARIIVCDPTGAQGNTSGAAAEWIGALIEAHRTMPRLDTPEILATLTGDTLRDIARNASERVGGSSKALRERLADSVEHMVLPGSAFHAPGPRRATRRPDGHAGPFPCAGCSDPEGCIRDVLCERSETGSDEA